MSFLYRWISSVSGGTCFSAMIRNGKCSELLHDATSKDQCCAARGITTAWSSEEFDSGTLFFWKVLGGGIPCVPCKGSKSFNFEPVNWWRWSLNVSDSCSGVECEENKMCVIRKGRPRCVCSSRCRVSKTVSKGPVCGTDGRSYKNICRLRKRACRRRSSTLTVDYNGLCQSMYISITITYVFTHT